jgi:hypothetical protein
VHKRDVCIKVNISVALLQHTRGMERECWCINVTAAAKELNQFKFPEGVGDYIHQKCMG